MDNVVKATLEKMRIAIVNYKCDLWLAIDEENDKDVIDKLENTIESLDDAYWNLSDLTKED